MMIKARKFPGLFFFLIWLYLKYLDYMGNKKYCFINSALDGDFNGWFERNLRFNEHRVCL